MRVVEMEHSLHKGTELLRRFHYSYQFAADENEPRVDTEAFEIQVTVRTIGLTLR